MHASTPASPPAPRDLERHAPQRVLGALGIFERHVVEADRALLDAARHIGAIRRALAFEPHDPVDRLERDHGLRPASMLEATSAPTVMVPSMTRKTPTTTISR